jgi:hypothetical protein
MINRTDYFCILIYACFAVSGCDASRNGENETGDSADRQTISAVVSLGDRLDTIVLKRFEAPSHYSMKFTTYVPGDLQVQQSEPGSSEFVRFVAGDPSADSARAASVHFFFYPGGTTEHRARAQVNVFAGSRGVPMSERGSAPAPFSEEGVPPESGGIVPLRFDWAILEIPFTKGCLRTAADCMIGRIALGKQHDRFYHVVIQYPPAAASFMTLRADLIIRHWQWQG